MTRRRRRREAGWSPGLTHLDEIRSLAVATARFTVAPDNAIVKYSCWNGPHPCLQSYRSAASRWVPLAPRRVRVSSFRRTPDTTVHHSYSAARFGWAALRRLGGKASERDTLCSDRCRSQAARPCAGWVTVRPPPRSAQGQTCSTRDRLVPRRRLSPWQWGTFSPAGKRRLQQPRRVQAAAGERQGGGQQPAWAAPAPGPTARGGGRPKRRAARAAGTPADKANRSDEGCVPRRTTSATARGGRPGRTAREEATRVGRGVDKGPCATRARAWWSKSALSRPKVRPYGAGRPCRGAPSPPRRSGSSCCGSGGSPTLTPAGSSLGQRRVTSAPLRALGVVS